MASKPCLDTISAVTVLGIPSQALTAEASSFQSERSLFFIDRLLTAGPQIVLHSRFPREGGQVRDAVARRAFFNVIASTRC